jgi:enoyl-CoA hydratase/carnithine racemase
MTDYSTIIYEKQNYIATITLNRPDQLNSLSSLLFKELEDALEQSEKDAEVRVIVITGNGRYFCAGLDLKESAESSNLSPFEESWTDHGPVVINRIETLEKPVIAAVNGPALGGGFELCLACDMRIASEAANFGLPEIKLAAMPGAGGTQRLPRLIGVAKAKEMIYTGKSVKSEEALRLGIVNEVAPPEKLTETVMARAGELAEKSPLALKMVKLAISMGIEGSLSSGLELERRAGKLLSFSEDMKEGVRAFVEKRKPEYKGM